MTKDSRAERGQDVLCSVNGQMSIRQSRVLGVGEPTYKLPRLFGHGLEVLADPLCTAAVCNCIGDYLAPRDEVTALW
jgi:hypothetical protein